MTEPGEDLWACLMLPSKYLYLRFRRWLLARISQADDGQLSGAQSITD